MSEGPGQFDLTIDFGMAAEDYGRWRQGFPPEFYARLDNCGIARSAQRVLDLGTGTGAMAREWALRGCQVSALDPSTALLDEARKADAAAGVSIDYHIGVAEEIGFPDATFDLVSAATCWHWFERPLAAAEARRVLKPDGRLLIAHLDWFRQPGNVIDVTLQTIDRFNPATGNGRPHSFKFPAWLFELTAAGFDYWEVFGYRADLPYTHDAWRGRVRASGRVGPGMDDDTLSAFDTALGAALADHFAEPSLQVAHRVFALIAWRKD